MTKTWKKYIFEKLFFIALVSITNLLMLLSALRNILKYGKEYFESPKWIPLPKWLTDPKYGVHKTAFLENINLHYVESGPPDKPLMLMVHGYPEFWYSWNHQILEFQKDYRVVAVSLRGYHLSDKPQDVESYKTSILIEDLKQLIEYLGASRCILMGHDWGGAVCWSFAEVHPDMVHRLIVMNCPHRKAFNKVMSKGMNQLFRSWYMFFYQMPYFPEWISSRMEMKLMEDAFCSDNFGMKKRKMTSAELLAYKANMMQPGAMTAAMNFYRAVFRYPIETDLNIDPKALLIWGTEDAALSLPLAAACQNHCRDLTVKYMEGASHWVQQDVPEEVNAAVREFLQQEGDD